MSIQSISLFNRIGVLFIILMNIFFTMSSAIAQTLTVGLYPYVPRVQQFQDVLAAQWRQVHPDIELKFLSADDWDGGYTKDPPPGADIFVFDAIYLAQFQAQHNLLTFAPGEVQNIGDFLPYAINGATSGGNVLAIPLLGCSNILFYQKGDAALVQATTFTQVTQSVKQCTFTSLIPPDRRGIMIDMAGGTTNAALYADIDHAITGAYPLPEPAPKDLDQRSIAEMKRLLASSSFYNASNSSSDQYQRSAWFSGGFGRAVIGFTESMSQMSQNTLDNIDFKVMPLSDDPGRRPLFYADMIGVNATTQQRGTTALAKELANVLASTTNIVNSLKGTASAPMPQYLLPVRASVFTALSTSYPLYKKMKSLTDTNPLLFSLGTDARTWIDNVKNTVKSESRADYPCGCDFPAPQPIADNRAAAAICSSTCSGHGSWNGNWTNAYPVVGSVCQCTACPISGEANAASRMAPLMSTRLSRPSKP